MYPWKSRLGFHEKKYVKYIFNLFSIWCLLWVKKSLGISDQHSHPFICKVPPVDSWLHSKLTEISQRERLLSPFRNQSFFTIVILYANNLCSKLATHYAEIGLFMTLEKWRTLSPPESSSSANASCRVPFAWSPHANFKIDISQP